MAVHFAFVGACIHRAERCFEMVLSTGLIDLPTYKGGNSPLSMCIEGHFSSSRAHMVRKLVRHGHPIGRGMSSDQFRFVYLLCKPTNSRDHFAKTWWWMDQKKRTTCS